MPSREQIMLEGVPGRCGPSGQPALDKDVRQMPGDRLVADHQSLRDLTVGLAGRHQGQDLHLALGEPIRQPGRLPERRDLARVESRPKPIEDLGCGIQSTGGAVGV